MVRLRSMLLILCAVLTLRAVEPIRVGMDDWTTLNPLLVARDTDVQVTDLLFDPDYLKNGRHFLMFRSQGTEAGPKSGKQLVLNASPDDTDFH